MTNQNWQINIENLAASVSAKYGSEVVEFVFKRYGATCVEDVSPLYYSNVFSELFFLDENEEDYGLDV